MLEKSVRALFPSYKTAVFTFLVPFLLFLSCQAQKKENFLDKIPSNIPREEVKNSQLSAIILIDKNGIPHIKSDDFLSGIFALGYIMAKARYSQLDLLRVISNGMVSSIIDIEQAREVDALTLRTLLNPSTGKLVTDIQWELLQSQKLSSALLLLAFTEGINFYIKRLSEGLEELPPEYSSILSARNPKNDPQKFFFTPQQVLAIARFFEWYLTGEGDLALDSLREYIKEVVGDEVFGSYFLEMLTARAGVNIFTLPAPPSLPNPIIFDVLDFLSASGKFGSNNWVISATLTADGKPIVANDPHLPLFNPPLWFPWKGEFGKDIIEGFALAGIPGILSGTNGKVAWAVTNGGYDSLDIYKEFLKADANCKTGFKFIHNHSRPSDDLCVESSEIKISSSRSFELFYCKKHGVILGKREEVLKGKIPAQVVLSEGEFLSFRWNGGEQSREVLVFLDILLAEDVQEFLKRATDFEVAPINFVVADLKGNIGYSTYALLPDRKWNLYQFPPIVALPTDGCCDWERWIEKSKFPHTINPPKGFIATANNDLPGYTADGDPFDDPIYLFWSYDPGYRIAEITYMIQEKLKKGKISVSDVKEVQHDTVSYWTRGFLPSFLNALSSFQTDMTDLEKKALSLLRSWDMTCKSGFTLSDLESLRFNEVDDQNVRKNSSACTIFWVSVTNIIKNTFSDEFEKYKLKISPSFEDYFLKQLYFFSQGTHKIDFFDDLRTDSVRENFEYIAFLSFRQAVSYLSEKFGQNPESWLWGRLSKLKLFHFTSFANLSLFDIGPFPVDFGPVAPSVAWVYLVTDNPEKDFIIQGGPSMRSVAVPDDKSGLFSIEFAFPGGIFGFGKDLQKPDISKHFNDLLPTYFGKDYIKFKRLTDFDNFEKVIVLTRD